MLNPADFGFGGLFNLVGEAVIVADAESNSIQLWNDAASRMFGYSVEEATGAPVSLIVPEELRDVHVAGVHRFASRGTIDLTPPGETVEVPAVRKNGERFWVELSLTALHRPHRGIVLALLRDVTDRRHAQDELKRANQALRDFVAVAAHDLRSPTAAIRMGSEMLLELLKRIDVPNDARELAEIVERQAQAQLALIEDLLDLASLDAGTVRIAPETLWIADEVTRAVTDRENLSVSVASDLACIADVRHVERILTNLVTNAYQHGTPPVTVTATKAEHMVEIAVCDSGEGVPAEFLPHLFNPYVMGASSKGTGLGLSIARRLAQANNGDLHYQQTDEHGSCFVLRLPSAAAPEEPGPGGVA